MALMLRLGALVFLSIFASIGLAAGTASEAPDRVNQQRNTATPDLSNPHPNQPATSNADVHRNTAAPDATTEVARLLAQSCTGCHGQTAASTIPAINAISPADLQRMLGEFRRGDRPSTIMGRITPAYSDNEIQLLAKGLLQLGREPNGGE